jgi:APA family basic amino acid/polyamine antiporter
MSIIDGGNIYVGIDAAYVLLGSVGMYIVIFTMLISVFGALNGSIIVFPRVYYAMSKDGVFFKAFSTLDKKYKTPVYAIIGSGVMASLLMVFGLDDLISLVAFGGLAFNILIFSSLFVFRKKRPNMERPYKVWAYPVSVVVVIVITFALLVATYLESFTSSLIGTGLILLGLPFYYLFEKINQS